MGKRLEPEERGETFHEGGPWWVEVRRREVSGLLVGFVHKMATNQNYGRILGYTSTKPPTIPAPNNQTPTQTGTAINENRTQ